MFKSGAEFDRIFDREASGTARKYGSSFSRRDVNTGDASFDLRDTDETCREEERSRDGLRRTDCERRTEEEDKFDIC